MTTRRTAAPLAIRLADEDAERVRKSHADAIAELQSKPAMDAQIISDVELPDSKLVLVPHRLGRKPRIVLLSPPRGATLAGLIDEIRDVSSPLAAGAGNPDRTKYVALIAAGMGADITVDVEVK